MRNGDQLANKLRRKGLQDCVAGKRDNAAPARQESALCMKMLVCGSNLRGDRLLLDNENVGIDSLLGSDLVIGLLVLFFLDDVGDLRLLDHGKGSDDSPEVVADLRDH